MRRCNRMWRVTYNLRARLTAANAGVLAVVAMLSAFSAPAMGQSGSKHINARRVTLDAVLSCADDPILQSAFRTNTLDMLRLSSIEMATTKTKIDDRSMALRAKGFYTESIGDNTESPSFMIRPVNGIGEFIKDSNLPFCHDHAVAHFDSQTAKSVLDGPFHIEISGDGWFLNPNEIFVHADQFQFRSGVFEDSSDVYFTAQKGRVNIQFLSKPDGLRFYRATYLP